MSRVRIVAAATLAFATLAGTTSGSAAAARQVVFQPTVRVLGEARAAPATTAQCEAGLQLACYSPRQLQAAYNLPAVYGRKITGRGETIVIVDAFGSPTITRDLTHFDTTYHLPAPPSFKVISPVGKVPAFVKTDNRKGWAAETTLDVEYAHAVAPGASILLVTIPTDEGDGSSAFSIVVKAEQYVINHKFGQVISQSFGAAEATFSSKAALAAQRSAFISAAAHHVTVLAAAGDDGATGQHGHGTLYAHRAVEWPATDPLVTGVGGTSLHLDAAGARTSPDTVWNDNADAAAQRFFGVAHQVVPLATGGGRSTVFARPSYQKSVSTVVGGVRGMPDIAMSGACDGAVNAYQSFPGTHAGWYPVCGSSESTPLFAGIVAMADQAAHHALGLINPTLYALAAAHAPGLVDVTQGSTTVSFTQSGANHTVIGTSAHAGYDLASGVGTVNAGALVFELAGKP
jgi:subtilase family serine protease